MKSKPTIVRSNAIKNTYFFFFFWISGIFNPDKTIFRLFVVIQLQTSYSIIMYFMFYIIHILC